MAGDPRRDLLAPSPLPAAGDSDLPLDVSARAAVIHSMDSAHHRTKLPPPPRPPTSSAGESGRRDLVLPSPHPAAGESDLFLDASARAAANAAAVHTPTGTSRARSKLHPASRPSPSSAGTSSTPTLPRADSILEMEDEAEVPRRVQLLAKQQKPPIKKFMSPVVRMVVKSPGIRLMLSPKVRSPSTAAARGSPSTAAARRSPSTAAARGSPSAARGSQTPTPLPCSPNGKRPGSSTICHSASTVPSESAFSSAQKTISDYRSRLASDTVEALICLQDWLREEDSTLDDIAGNVIGDEDSEDDV